MSPRIRVRVRVHHQTEPVAVLLLRHAIAVSRPQWQGDDNDRPLTDAGRRQALALVELLAVYEPSVVMASPAVRCQQTVEPLAASLGLPLACHPDLAEGSTREAVALVRSLDVNAVLCSHGDVIPHVLETLDREDGLAFATQPRWMKASTWVLDRGASEWRASYLPPPPG